MQSLKFSRSKILRPLLGLGLIVAWAGCQPDPTSGQVFVVTPTGESLRLGSVRVQIFDEERVQNHLRQREQEIADHRRALKEELSQLEAALAEERDSAAQAEQAYFRREAEIRVELAAFLEEGESQAVALQRQIHANVAFIASRDSLPPAPEGVPTRQESEAYEERRRKWLSMTRAERTEWAESLSTRNAELEEQFAALAKARDQKLMGFGDELQALDAVHEAAQSKLAETQGAINAIAAELVRPLTSAEFLADLPEPVREMRTDADGEFIVKLPSGRRYVLLAEAERQFGGERQEFQWFVRMGETAGARVLLSNHNLITTSASENVIDLPAKTVATEI